MCMLTLKFGHTQKKGYDLPFFLFTYSHDKQFSAGVLVVEKNLL